MELIIPIQGDCLVYVGPPDHLDNPPQMPPLERFQVFHVRQRQGMLLGHGVWHGAPLALERPLNVVVLLHHNTGQEDRVVVRFPDSPVAIRSHP
jgi:ureidoglycolate hydrolase